MDSAHPKLALLEKLPLELLFLIIDDLLDTNEVLKLALTSRWMNHVCNTRLYRSFEYVAQTPEQDKLFGNFLRALDNRPSVRQYVKDITIDERSLVPLQTLGQNVRIRIPDELTYEEYKDFVERLRFRSLRKTADMRHRLGRLLALCGELTNLHISVFGGDPIFCTQILCKQDYANVLAPLLRAADGGVRHSGNQFSQLAVLSLDLRSCKTSAVFLGQVLDILSFSSLKKSMLTFHSLESSHINGEPRSVPSIEELHLHVEATPITTLSRFISCFTNLTVFTYFHAGNTGFPSNVFSALRNSASTLQRIDICTDTDRLRSENRSLLGYQPFEALRTLSLPLPHFCQWSQTGSSRSQQLRKLADDLIGGLPAGLQRVSFSMTADLTLRVPVLTDSVRNDLIFNEHGEHLFWSLLRQRLGTRPLDSGTSQALSHISNVLESQREVYGRTADVTIRSLMVNWDRLQGKTSCDCDDLFKEAWEIVLPHFIQLNKVELLHFETELAAKSRRYGKAEHIYRTGAERGITIWER